MKKLREYIEKNIIVIPPPPDLETKIEELNYIKKRRDDPVTADKYSKILDINGAEIFNQILINAGFRDHKQAILDLQKEIIPEIYFHKKYFNQMRPNEFAKYIGDNLNYDYLESAQTPSYPSGHTAQAFYIAYCLSNKFPSLKKPLYKAADMIAESRIDRGVHFPSDNEAGKILARRLFIEKVT